MWFGVGVVRRGKGEQFSCLHLRPFHGSPILQGGGTIDTHSPGPPSNGCTLLSRVRAAGPPQGDTRGGSRNFAPDTAVEQGWVTVKDCTPTRHRLKEWQIGRHRVPSPCPAKRLIIKVRTAYRRLRWRCSLWKTNTITHMLSCATSAETSRCGKGGPLHLC